MLKALQEFYKDKSGNFAIIFGLSLFPIMLGAGLAVDYTQATREQGNAQDAFDVATIAAAKNIATMTDAELLDVAKSFLESNLSAEKFARLSNITISVDRVNGKVVLGADSYTPTTITGITGKKKFAYSLETGVEVGVGNLDIAMVLDNTFSMSADGKIDALKNSATDFVNSLFEIDNSGKLKISLVPFNEYVNVGLGNRNASWIDVPDDFSEEKEKTIKEVVAGSCVTVIRENDGVEYEAEDCDYTETGTETYTETYVWGGCVGSRNQPLNLKDVGYGNKVPGILMREGREDRECPNELLPLTSDKSELLDQIDNMRTSENTYIPAGVMWGWRALSASEPFAEGAVDANKVMVLMTDGDNRASADFSTGYHDEHDYDQANDTTAAACENAKADDIVIYTITFGEDIETDTKNLMQNCASSPDYYFDASDASALNKAFMEIMNQVGKIRISS